MVGDHLGNLRVDPEDIILRDQLVFQFAADLDVPIVMMLSGGYQYSNAKNISDSIKNLQVKFQVLG